jgi:signal transduction histidine kinase
MTMAISSPRQRILVIDDNPAVRDDFTRILCPRSDGESELARLQAAVFGTTAVRRRSSETVFDLVTCPDGTQGCEVAERARAEGRPYMVAFVDMRMPGGPDGLETIERLWRIDSLLQVVICTAYSDHGWQEIIDRLGASDQLLIIHKPFHPLEVQQLALALSTKWRLRQSERLSAIGQLAAGIAHELNNPLAVILGFAEGMERRIGEGDPLWLPVTSITREAQRCRGLVQELLTFSRIARPTPEDVDLNALVSASAVLLEARCRNQDVQVVQDLASPPPRLEAQRSQLQQILVNLGTNALDAMRGGGTLTLRTRTLEGYAVLLEVADTGEGMTDSVREQIFEPFFTTKEVGEGTGLGLSIVREIVQQHQGSIGVDSAPGRGTTMSIRLPIRGAEP